MRNKSDIQRELYNRLNSPTWQSLRNSLIGRELIAYGTELLYMQDSMNSAVVNSFDYRQADERALISLAHTYDMGLCFTAPSWLRLRLPTGRATDVFPPFSIRCTVGSVVYTNLHYYSGNQVITLYQGTVKTMMYQPGYGNISFVNENYLTNEDWNTTELTKDGEIVYVHNLGEAIPESVFVFVGELSAQHQVSRVKLLSEFSPMRYGSDVYSFKEYTNFDGTLGVVDGDGVWGAQLNGFDLYQIVWLQPSHVDVDVDSVRFTANGTTYDGVYIISSAQGQDGVVYAREAFTRAIYKLLPVVSKAQIREFVSAFNYILDAEVVADANIVTVYVKPEDFADEYQFGEVASELDIRSQLGAEFIVTPGDYSLLTVYVKGTLSESEKTQVESLILSNFRYEDMPFDWLPNAAAIAGLIQSNLGLNVQCSFKVGLNLAQVSSVESDFLPVQGTIKVYTPDNQAVGEDVNKQIVAINTLETIDANQVPVRAFGKFIASLYGYPSNFTGEGEGFNFLDGVASTIFGFPNLRSDNGDTSGSISAIETGCTGDGGYLFADRSVTTGTTVYYTGIYLLNNLDISASVYINEKANLAYAKVAVEDAGFKRFAALRFSSYVIYLEASADTLRMKFLNFSDFANDNEWSSAESATMPDATVQLYRDFALSGMELVNGGVKVPGSCVFIYDGKLVLLTKNKALVVYELGSVNMVASVFTLEIDNEDLEAAALAGTVCWGYADGVLSAIGYKDTDKILGWRIDSISVASNKVVLSAVSELSIPSVSISGFGDNADIFVSAGAVGTAAILQTNAYDIYEIDFVSGKVYRTILTGDREVLGTVDYSTGKITLNGPTNDKIEFESFNVQRPKGVYYMINEAEPCTWN